MVPISYKDPLQAEAARKIYTGLEQAGVEVVLDDRDERPGVKFKDADLIGFPVRINVGPRSLEHGNVEVMLRRSKKNWSKCLWIRLSTSCGR